jgi:hypothetical protein
MAGKGDMSIGSEHIRSTLRARDIKLGQIKCSRSDRELQRDPIKLISFKVCQSWSSIRIWRAGEAEVGNDDHEV